MYLYTKPHLYIALEWGRWIGWVFPKTVTATDICTSISPSLQIDAPRLTFTTLKASRDFRGKTPRWVWKNRVVKVGSDLDWDKVKVRVQILKSVWHWVTRGNPLKPIWSGNRCFWMIRINSWCFQYLCSNWCTVEVHLKWRLYWGPKTIALSDFWQIDLSFASCKVYRMQFGGWFAW